MRPSLAVCVAVIGGAAALSLMLTGLIRRWALARSVVDTPNSRSLHSAPVPRGGGLAIVIVVLAFLFGAAVTGLIARTTALGIGGGGLLLAAVGLLDDVRSISAKLRLAVHFLAAIWTTTWLGGMPTLGIGTTAVDLGVTGHVLAVIGLVWAANLFNFMDGSDGIAATEALFVAGIGGALLWRGGAVGLALLCAVLAAACAGFLWWNWSPARIFMGDVCSGFLGFVLAGIAIASEAAAAVPVALWAVLAAVFILDATVTFLRRLRTSRLGEAHRAHAYQRLVQYGWSHRRVALATGALTLGLGGLAAVGSVNPILVLPVLLAGYLAVGIAYVLVERVAPLHAK